MLIVTLPKRLEKILVVKNGTPTATRLKIRVLSAKFGKRFTTRSKSPIVSPEKPPAPRGRPRSTRRRLRRRRPQQVDTDDDNDLLVRTLEKSLSKLLDTCKADTDDDGVEDGYEYQSARDLNDDEDQNPNAVHPVPAQDVRTRTRSTARTPTPITTATPDADGGVQALEVHGPATARAAHTTRRRAYSRSVRAAVLASAVARRAAGYDKQATSSPGRAATATWSSCRTSDVDARRHAPPNWWARPRRSTTSATSTVTAAPRDERDYYDFRRDGFLNDAERDEDADGLTNWWETRGCMTPRYWNGLYDDETPYYLAYAGTALDDADTDGDGMLDGADDQDHDDVPNIMECTRSLAAGGARLRRHRPTTRPAAHPLEGFVNPFNPCLPHAWSRTCKRIVPVEQRLGAVQHRTTRTRSSRTNRPPDTELDRGPPSGGPRSFHERVPGTPQPEGSEMADSVYRVTEVIGVSSESWEAAARSAVETAAKTVRDLRVAEVVREDVTIENGTISAFRVRLAISFKYDSGD